MIRARRYRTSEVLPNVWQRASNPFMTASFQSDTKMRAVSIMENRLMAKLSIHEQANLVRYAIKAAIAKLQGHPGPAPH